MEFEGGHRAVISWDSGIGMFRGEFLDLNGGADFYAEDLASLKKEGEISLRVFREMCQEDGVPVRKPQKKPAAHNAHAGIMPRP